MTGLRVTSIVLILLACSEDATMPSEVTSTAGATQDWWIHRGDRSLSGVAKGSLSDKPELAWTFPTEGAVTSSAAIVDGVVYIGSVDGHLYALDLETGEKKWSYKTEDSVESAPLVLDGKIYFGSNDCFVYCLDAKDGKFNWKFETYEKVIGSANFVKTEDGRTNLLVGSHDANLYCLEAATGKKIWSYETMNYVNGTPSISGNRVVFGGCDAVLHVVDVRTGKVTSEVELGTECYVPGSVVHIGTKVYVGHFGNAFACIDLKNEKNDWAYLNDAHPFFSSPAVGKDRIVIGCRDRKLHCVDRKSGKGIWTFPTRRKIDGSPVICGDKVVFGSGDGRVYMVRLADGKEVWQYELGRAIVSSPAISRGMIVIGSNDKSVYAFRARP